MDQATVPSSEVASYHRKQLTQRFDVIQTNQ